MTSRAVRAEGQPAATLTEWLRRRSDQELAELLRRRPDLALPAPADLATLASRIGVRTSVQRVVDGLAAYPLRVLEALVLAADDERPLRLESIIPLLAGLPLAAALDELRTVTLIWGEDEALHLAGGVRDAIGPYPAGLGRPAGQLLRGVSEVTLVPVLRRLGLPPSSQPRAGAAVAAVLSTPAMLDRLIADCGPAEREVLDRLAAGPPIGLVRDALLPAADPVTPPDRLIASGLVVPIDMQTVELPREIGMALRGAHPLGEISAEPPPIELTERPATELDRLGTTAVLRLVNLVESLAQEWTRHPPAELRNGGVGVRELRRTARALDLEEGAAALVIEVVAAAGLLGSTPWPDPVYLPTADFDDWLRREPARKWTQLSAAWLTMTRQPSLVGLRDERDRLTTVLSPDAERGTVPALRSQVLGALADLPQGAAPADPRAVLTRLDWLAPRRALAQRRSAEAVLAEAELLGITAAGSLTGYGRALLGKGTGGQSAAEEALTATLPDPVDHFLVQPDLTVVVPGPPTAELARELALAADVESTGGAHVYRITEASVRRALDAGRSGADLVELFANHSRTPLPQALRYVIDDVARRHGVLRAGVASAYLRCDDETLLSGVLAARAAEPLGLRRIAPTVLISTGPVARIVEVLRDAGYAPSAEAGDGAIISIDADPPRAPSRPISRMSRGRTLSDSPGHIMELIRRMRAGDQLFQLRSQMRPIASNVPGVTTASTLSMLRDAVRAGDPIWLSYVDDSGRVSQHAIEPISVAGGMLRGHDLDTGALESFALHHIAAVNLLDDDL